jgi:hypothetical protein
MKFETLNKYMQMFIGIIAIAEYKSFDTTVADKISLTKYLFSNFVEDIDHNLSVLIVDWLWLQ